MRTYEEKAQSVLHRIEEEKEIIRKRNKKLARGAAWIMSFCLVVVVAFGTIKSGWGKSTAAPAMEPEAEEYQYLFERDQAIPELAEEPMEAQPESEEEPMEAVAEPTEACYPDEPMEDVVARSSLVAFGEITACSEPFGIQPTFGGDPMPYYDWTFSIEELYRGESKTDTITVRTMQSVDEFLSTGDSVLLFLYQPHMGGGYNTEGDYYYIASVVNGIYTMEQIDGNIRLKDDMGRTVDWERLQTLFAQYPVDEAKAKNDYLESVQRNAEQNQYAPTMEEALSDIEQYAEIVPLP